MIHPCNNTNVRFAPASSRRPGIRPQAAALAASIDDGDRSRRVEAGRGNVRRAAARAGAAAIALLLLSGRAAIADVATFSQKPAANSVEWRAFAELAGAVVVDSMRFEGHPDGELDPLWFLCSHGAALRGLCMIDVETGSGLEFGSLAAPLSAGEGPLVESTYLYNGWAGSWELIVDFRRPVAGVGVMTADHFNPFGLNAMKLEAFDRIAGGGARLGAADSPALNFQLNNRLFIGIVDTEARIRSIRLSCPNVHLDTVLIESIAVAIDPAIEAEPPPDADIDMDGWVTASDLGLLLGLWGSGCSAADLNGDGVVDGIDMGILLASWNEPPEALGGGGGDDDRPSSATPGTGALSPPGPDSSPGTPLLGAGAPERPMASPARRASPTGTAGLAGLAGRSVEADEDLRRGIAGSRR
ncbi:MAG TPA: hypothetical protein PKC43_08340 [Phycisphaerales bacterium]|nr:hypothetical protein [Phycisphaerales bacterium]HMP37444.1 hypothetical protein [Phycisphaerales bacterium]